MTITLSPELTEIHTNIICWDLNIPKGSDYLFPIDENGNFLNAVQKAIIQMREKGDTSKGLELKKIPNVELFYEALKEANPIGYIYKHFYLPFQPTYHHFRDEKYVNNKRIIRKYDPVIFDTPCFSEEMLNGYISHEDYKRAYLEGFIKRFDNINQIIKEERAENIRLAQERYKEDEKNISKQLMDELDKNRKKYKEAWEESNVFIKNAKYSSQYNSYWAKYSKLETQVMDLAGTTGLFLNFFVEILYWLEIMPEHEGIKNVNEMLNHWFE